MKVKQLIAKLEKLDPDAQVVLQRDPEGNGFSPAVGVEPSIVTEDGYGLNVYDLKWSAEDCGLEEDEWEKLKKNKKAQAVVLWPES